MSTTEFVPSSTSPVADRLVALIQNMATRNVTDLHLNRDAPAKARMRGKLLLAEGWSGITRSDGRFAPEFVYQEVRRELLGGVEDGSTVVYRLKSHQLRIQLIRDDRREKLVLRLQPNTPPPLEKLLENHPKTLELITAAKGLILVSGPIGGGKTTLASSMAMYLAERDRHVITMEDPVEYELRPERGDISQFSCRMGLDFAKEAEAAPAAQPRTAPGDLFDLARQSAQISHRIRPRLISDLIPLILRSDMDGLYLGECRTNEALETCLTFAGMREPVITTFQSGGIADALTRLIVNTGKLVGQETARLTIAQCVQAVLYVNLAYTGRGSAVPVIMCYPVGNTNTRKLLSEQSPFQFANQTEASLNDGQTGEGYINRVQAMGTARKNGATEESILEALPPLIQDQKPATPLAR